MLYTMCLRTSLGALDSLHLIINIYIYIYIRSWCPPSLLSMLLLQSIYIYTQTHTHHTNTVCLQFEPNSRFFISSTLINAGTLELRDAFGNIATTSSKPLYAILETGMPVYACVYIHVDSANLCMLSWMWAYVWIWICNFEQAPPWNFGSMCVCVCVYACVRIRTYMHACTHIQWSTLYASTRRYKHIYVEYVIWE